MYRIIYYFVAPNIKAETKYTLRQTKRMFLAITLQILRRILLLYIYIRDALLSRVSIQVLCVNLLLYELFGKCGTSDSEACKANILFVLFHPFCET